MGQMLFQKYQRLIRCTIPYIALQCNALLGVGGFWLSLFHAYWSIAATFPPGSGERRKEGLSSIHSAGASSEPMATRFH